MQYNQQEYEDSIQFSREVSSDWELLDQTIEECSELIQAISKLKRVWNQTCSLTENEALMQVTEECADVLRCLDLITIPNATSGLGGLLDLECVNRIKMYKASRWKRRFVSGDWGIE